MTYNISLNGYFRKASDEIQTEILNEIRSGLEYLSKRSKFWKENTSTSSPRIRPMIGTLWYNLKYYKVDREKFKFKKEEKS